VRAIGVFDGASGVPSFLSEKRQSRFEVELVEPAPSILSCGAGQPTFLIAPGVAVALRSGFGNAIFFFTTLIATCRGLALATFLPR
jgi:hypothetical protein